MKLLKGNSFLTGFVTAILIVALACAWWNAGLMGGRHADSPDGAYLLHVTAPINPQRSGTYTVVLIQESNEDVLRRVTVDLSESESTPLVRDNGASIVWDANSRYVDVTIDGDDSIRVWVPGKLRQRDSS